MIIDGKLLRQEYFLDDVSIRFKCVITKEEFLECYNAWVNPTDTTEPKVDTHTKYWDTVEKADILQELPQYHFDRDAFVSTFEQVFTESEIDNIEDMCQQRTTLNEFLLFYHPDWEEFYIIHLPSGTIINWYKHLGRTNTCNKENFTISDLEKLLEMLKVEMKENKNDT
jgi:hypothetical protein